MPESETRLAFFRLFQVIVIAGCNWWAVH